ncbi:MAG: hypothetical protein LUG27_10385 [Clostridiales bacterium]|nr:hypothetical protein [Clostridiales bacterium]
MEELNRAGLYYDLGGVVMPKQLGNLRQIVADSHIRMAVTHRLRRSRSV